MQDADFEGEVEPSKKKRRKDKKGKKKSRAAQSQDVAEDTATVEEDEGLTVAQKAKKVKKAMDEYKALDHEDMVRHSLSSLLACLSVCSFLKSCANASRS